MIVRRPAEPVTHLLFPGWCMGTLDPVVEKQRISVGVQSD